MSPSASEIDTMETSSGVGSDHTHLLPLLQSMNSNQKESEWNSKELLNQTDAAYKEEYEYQNVRVINETDV